MGVRPGEFTPFNSLPQGQQALIIANIPLVDLDRSNTWVAMPREQGANPGGGLIYAEFQKQYAVMEGTISTPQTAIVDVISWYMRTFVFIERPGVVFQTYTPSVGKQFGIKNSAQGSSVKLEIDTEETSGLLSTFHPIDDAYQWEVNGLYLHFNSETGEITFESQAQATKFTFHEPPPECELVEIKGTNLALNLKPYIELEEEMKRLIANNISVYSNMKSSLHAARINVRNNEDGDQRLYVELQLEKANLKATPPNTGVDFNEVSWYQYYFVFAQKDEVSFEVFTPVAKQNLGLAIVGKTQSFSPSPPYGWTVFQFTAADNNYWYWKVKGENLYLYCDPVTGDITATNDLSKRSQFSFLYDEDENQPDGRPPEQEVCKQEASEQEPGEQEAGIQRKTCKVQ